jgi:hypothetical protein
LNLGDKDEAHNTTAEEERRKRKSGEDEEVDEIELRYILVELARRRAEEKEGLKQSCRKWRGSSKRKKKKWY